MQEFFAEVDVTDLLPAGGVKPAPGEKVIAYGAAKKKTEAENLASAQAVKLLRDRGITPDKVTLSLSLFLSVSTNTLIHNTIDISTAAGGGICKSKRYYNQEKERHHTYNNNNKYGGEQKTTQ